MLCNSPSVSRQKLLMVKKKFPSSSKLPSATRDLKWYGVYFMSNTCQSLTISNQIPQPLPVRPGGSPYSHINTRDRLAIFERLQFKLATANNGRRRMGVQQYYKLTMELHATLENGESVVLASIDSCSLVVRGRSPNHYLDIDIPKRGLMASPMMSTTMSPSTGFAALSLQRTPQMECQSPLSTHVFTFNPMTSPPSTATASPNRTPGLVNLAFMGTSSQREIRPQLLTSPHLNELPPLLIPQHVSRQRSETVSSINSAVSLEELCEFPTNLEMPASLQDLMYPTDTKDFSLNMDMPTTTGPLPTMASTVSPSQSFEALSYPAVSFQSPSLMSPAAISEFGGFF